MSNWIFVIKSTVGELENRITKKSWPIYHHTPHRKNLRFSDRIIFYLAGHGGKKFVGNASISSELMSSGGLDYSIGISDIKIWKKPIPVEDLISNLEFVVNKNNWGASFQSGVRRLNDNDYNTILSKSRKNNL